MTQTPPPRSVFIMAYAECDELDVVGPFAVLTGPNATAQQLRNALAGIVNWPGILGRYDFRAIPNRGLGEKAVVIARWDPARSLWTAAK
jgi:hypothetical protein